MEDKKLIKWLFLLLLLPLTLAYFSGDRFRYPCQDPSNWDKDECKYPICDVTRTCPEHIFKGQRDPRLGPPKDGQNQTTTQSINQSFAGTTTTCPATPTSPGANCGK